HLAVVSRPVDCYSRPFILPHTPPSLPLQLLHASGGRLDHGGCAWFYNSALCVVCVCVSVCVSVCGCVCVCECVLVPEWRGQMYTHELVRMKVPWVIDVGLKEEVLV